MALRARALAYLSDGSSRDVTETASWRVHETGEFSSFRQGSVRAGNVDGLDVGAWSLSVNLDGPGASESILVMPAGTFALAGSVRMIGSWMPISQATVRMNGARQLQTSTTNDGFYNLLAVPNGAEIEVTHRDFVRATQRASVGDHTSRLDFTLAEGPSLVRIDGAYRLTVTADPNCSTTWGSVQLEPLADQFKLRTYEATVTQVANTLTVELRSGSFAHGLNKFPGRLRPGLVDFSFVYSHWDWPPAPVIEYVAQSTYFLFDGSATVSPTSLSGTFDGSLLIADGPYGWTGNIVAACTSDAHRFQLSR